MQSMEATIQVPAGMRANKAECPPKIDTFPLLRQRIEWPKERTILGSNFSFCQFSFQKAKPEIIMSIQNQGERETNYLDFN